MKIILEEQDKELIDTINKGLEAGQNPPLVINKTGNKYYIEFECVDVAKANIFCFWLLAQDREEEQADKLGLIANNLWYDKPKQSTVSRLKDLLKEAFKILDTEDKII